MAGELKIKTRIDESGLEKGLANMGAALNRFVSRVVSGARQVDGAWGAKQQAKADALSKAIARQTEAVKKQEAAVEQLKAKLDAVGTTGNQPKLAVALEKEIKTAQAQVDELLVKFNELSDQQEFNVSAGIDPQKVAATDAELERMGEVIRAAETDVAALQAKLDALRANPQASAEGQKLASDLDLATQKLDRLRNEAASSQAALDQLMGQKPPEAENSARRLGSALGGVRSEASKTEGAFARIGKKIDDFKRRVTQLFVAAVVFNVMRRAITSLTNYMGKLLMANKQFSASLAGIRGNLMSAFAPIYSAILPAINALMSALRTLTAIFAGFVSMLFGKSVASANASAKAMDKEANAIGGAGSAAKKASKELAHFDEINVLNKEDGSGGGGGGSGALPIPETPELPVGLQEFFANVLEILQPTINALGNLWDALKLVGSFAWQGLVGFYDNFLAPVGSWALSEDGLPRLINTLADMLRKVKWQKILNSLNRLWKALAPFAINVGKGLVWFWEKFLMPIAGWVLSEVVPRFLEMLANAVDIANNVIEAAKPTFQSFYDNILAPLGQWAADTFTASMDAVNSALQGIGDWIAKNQGIVQGFIVVITSFAAAWALVNAAILIWNTVGAIATGITTAFGAAVAFLTSPIFLVTAAIAAVIAIVWLLVENWDWVAQTAIAVWEWIKTAWAVAAEWLNTNVIIPIATFFSNLWQSIQDAATSTWLTIAGLWLLVSDWFDTNVVKPVTTFFTNLWEGIKSAATNAWLTIAGLWLLVSEWFNANVITPIATFFSNLWGGIKNAASTAWNGIVTTWAVVSGWFQENIISPIFNFFLGLSNDVQGFFSGAWSGIVSVWTAVAGWFGENVIDPIFNFFLGLSSNVQGFFSGAWSGIVSVWTAVAGWFQDNVIKPIHDAFESVAQFMKDVINGAIDIVNGAIGGIESGLNYIVGAVNKLSFDVPDWLGGGHVGFSLPEVSFARIPKLATGAVIPPRSEFAAILGDQKRGTNIEAPADLIRQIVREEVAGATKGGNQPINYTIEATGSLAQLIQLLHLELKREDNRMGAQLIAGGEFS